MSALPVTFLHPEAGWLLLLLPLVWVTAARTTRPVHRWWRIVTFACIAAALAMPGVVLRTGHARQVIVLDQNASLSAAARARGRAMLAAVLARRAPGDRVTLIQLGGTPVAAEVDDRVLLDPARGGGSLAVALDTALAAIPLGTGAAIRLIADGRSTGADWGRAIAAALHRGIPVDTLTVADDAPFVAAVRVAPVRAGEPVRVAVDLGGRGDGAVVVLDDGDRTVARAAPVSGGTAVLTLPAMRAGFRTFGVAIDGRLGRVDVPVAVQDPLRLLYLGERQAGGAASLQRLLGPGFAVAPGAAVAGFDFARWPLVMLDDQPAASLPTAVQRRLLAAVAGTGTGILYTGGEGAFGAGGYGGTPLAAALPVGLRQERKLEEPSVALAIVIDSSGSMAGDPLEIAKQVARVTVRTLTPADSIGVVEFYGSKQWAVPMQPARSIPDVERAIGRLQSQGSSMLFPAIEEAYYALKNVDARFKHILVISDGGVDEARYQQLIRHIADDRINVSTAQIGTDTAGETLMAEWARVGRGRFYAIPDENGLVQMTFKQPQAKPRSGYRQGRFPLVARGDATWWAGVAPAGMPPLDGYVPATPRSEAETLLATATGDPVLASWQVGNGRVTSFATEPVGQGTRAWQGWGGYGAWLARIAARTANQQPPLAIASSRDGDRLTIRVRRSAPATGTPELRLVDAAGRTVARPAAIEEKAPGLFVGDLRWPAARPALIEAQGDGGPVRAADAGAAGAPAMLPLAGLAALTGGVHADDAATLVRMAPKRAGGDWRVTDLWPCLSLLALFLYLAEIAWRRWPARRGVR